MTNAKKTFNLILIYVIAYILFHIFAPDSIFDIGNSMLSIIGSGFAAAVLLKASKNMGEYKKYGIFLSIASLFYFLGDVTWVHYQTYIGLDVPVFHINTIFYCMNNIMITIAIWYYVIKNLSKWNGMQLILDGIVFSVLLFYIFWTTILRFLVPEMLTFEFDTLVMSIYLFSDLLIILGVLIIFQSEENNKINKLHLVSFLFWSLGDVLYYYLYFNYYYNSGFEFDVIVDMFWPTILLLIAYSYICKFNNENVNVVNNNAKTLNKAPDKELAIPITVLYVLSIIASRNNIYLIIGFTALYAIRHLLTKFIYAYKFNEHLTINYKLVNNSLTLKTEELQQRTEELQQKNEELYTLANIDSLTGLPNRRNFVEYLDNLIHKKDGTGSFALFFIDLDRFKSINDWYGHDIGDELLIATSERLMANVSKCDFIARQGGDEFIVILDNINDANDALNKSKKLIEAFREPFIINGSKLISTISVGLSIYPLNTSNRSGLMKFADIALYRAKRDGKNVARLYNCDMKKEENRKLEIESKLYDSIENNELELYYQPQICTKTEKIIGIEALLRWTNPELGVVPPLEFIPIAEDNGFIINLGDWVLEEACKSIKTLNEKHNINLRIGINISTKQFLTSNLVYSIESNIKKYDLKSEWIDIEITESLSVNNEAKTIEKLNQLKELGISISIDDFGIGYSSLSYLKVYPINTLKIARELINGINSNPDDYKIVKAIISMCKDLNLNNIAEGVESEEQVNILKSLGCKEIQGYYYGKPMKFEDIEKFIF